MISLKQKLLFFQTSLEIKRILYASRFLLVVLHTTAASLGNFDRGGIEECIMRLCIRPLFLHLWRESQLLHVLCFVCSVLLHVNNKHTRMHTHSFYSFNRKFIHIVNLWAKHTFQCNQLFENLSWCILLLLCQNGCVRTSTCVNVYLCMLKC